MQKHIQKIRGSVLQYAVVTAVLIFFLVLSMVLLTHIQNYFKLQSQTFLESITQVNTQIEQSLTKDFVINNSNIENDSLHFKSDFLGAFERVTASTQIKGSIYKKTALIGTSSQKALYLADNQRPLVLVGNTNIKGKAYIPNVGVKAGAIAGTYFYGNKLVELPSYESGTILPELKKGFETHVRSLQNTNTIQENKIIPRSDRITNSFLEETKVIYEPQPLEIVEELIGNITVISDTKITVNSYAKLQDVTIIAPKVQIQKGFVGSLHIIASDSVVVEKNTVLQFPSSVILNEIKNKEEVHLSTITISEEATIEGSVLYLKNNEHKKQQSNITVSPNATILGAIYCEANLELKGIVQGSVYTHQFIAREKGSSYMNHILDGTIVSQKEIEQYVTLPLENEKKGVVRWLY